jgi:hypothetical protein
MARGLRFTGFFVLVVERRDDALGQGGQEWWAAAFEVGDLPFDDGEPFVLSRRCFRAGNRPFDHPHAVGKRADLAEAEPCRDQPSNLLDLLEGRCGEGAIPVPGSNGRKKPVVVVVANHVYAHAGGAREAADRQGMLHAVAVHTRMYTADA